MADRPTTLGEVSERYLNWILDPIGQCTLFLGDEVKIHTVVTRGVTSMQSVPMLIGLVRLALQQQQLPLPPNIDRKDLDQKLQWLSANTPAKAAAEIQTADFAVPNAHSFIALWGGLEVCMEDTFTLVLMNDAPARQAVRAKHPKLKLDDSAQPDEDACRRAVGQWERLERDGHSIAQAWTHMLATIGIATALDPTTDATITEANAIRNVLMHRRGRVDAHAVKHAPSLASKLGQVLTISRSDYLRFYDAIGKYTTNLMAAIVASRYIRTIATPSPSAPPPRA